MAWQDHPCRTAAAVGARLPRLWQLVAASGIWNETFVPYPAPSGGPSSTSPPPTTGPRLPGLPAVGAPVHDAAPRPGGRRDRRGDRVVLGLVMGTVGWVRRVLEPWLTFLRALPPLAYFFLLVIWLGIDEAPKITLLALAALPPAAVATTAAVVAAPVGLIEAARALGASRRRSSATSSSRRRCRRRSPASGSRSASPTPRWSPRNCSTASPASAAWSRTPATTTTPRSCWSASSPSASPDWSSTALLRATERRAGSLERKIYEITSKAVFAASRPRRGTALAGSRSGSMPVGGSRRPQADHPGRLPDLPERRPGRQEQPLARGGPARTTTSSGRSSTPAPTSTPRSSPRSSTSVRSGRARWPAACPRR